MFWSATVVTPSSTGSVSMARAVARTESASNRPSRHHHAGNVQVVAVPDGWPLWTSDDGQTIETTRRMGTGKKTRTRRVVWQWSFTRCRHDIQAINAMVERAEAIAAGNGS